MPPELNQLDQSKLIYLLIQSTTDALIALNLDGKIFVWNPAAEDLFGRSRSEALGQDLMSFVPEASKAEFHELLKRLKSEPGNQKLETTFLIVKNEQPHYIMANLSPILDEHGSCTGTSIVAHDATQQRQLELERIMLSAIVESSDDAIISEDLDGIITSWNKGAERIFGYRADEAIGRHISILAPETASESEIMLEKIRQGERIDHYETVRTRKDGMLVNVAITMSPMHDTKGKLFGISKISRDITLTKALSRDRAFLARIVESSDDAILSKNMQGTILTWNKGAEKLYGYTKDEVIGKNVRVLAAPEVANEIPKIMERIAAGEHIDHYETIRVKKNGERMNVSVTISPVRDDQGTIFAASAITRDITEKTRTEQIIRKQLAEKEVLLQEVHHRVKNNLQIIASLLDLRSRAIKGDLDNQSAFAESVERIRAISLVHEMLYRSPNLSTVDFRGYLESLSSHLLKASQPGIQFIFEGESCLMSLNAAVPLGLIFNELFSNSVKYAFPKGRKGTIKVDTRISNGVFQSIYCDDGKGLPPGFDLNSTNTFGFRIVRLLVAQINGSFELQQQDKGTAFTLKVPMQELK